MAIQVPVGLFNDITEIYAINSDRPPSEMLAELNSPGRIQRRGYVVSEAQLLSLVIALWLVDERSRFCLYNYSDNELASTRVYDTALAAAEDAEELSAMIVRFQT